MVRMPALLYETNISCPQSIESCAILGSGYTTVVHNSFVNAGEVCTSVLFFFIEASSIQLPHFIQFGTVQPYPENYKVV